jgi:adenine-specific DNA methylase
MYTKSFTADRATLCSKRHNSSVYNYYAQHATLAIEDIIFHIEACGDYSKFLMPKDQFI